MSDNPFHASAWRLVDGFADLTDITYHRHINDATVRVAFNRPEVRNAFRLHTVDELYGARSRLRPVPALLLMVALCDERRCLAIHA